MDIKLLSFSEALELLKAEEIDLLLRAKHMEADFSKRCILLYLTDKYVTYGASCVKDRPDILWQSIRENGKTVSSAACIETEDLLAEDYIDPRQWTVCKTEEEYKSVVNR